MNIDAAWWPDIAKSTTMATAQRGSGTKSPDYAYCKIKDTKNGTIVNMYGVVKSFKLPSVTQSGLQMTTIQIVDETCEENNCLTCLLISNDKREIPDSVQVGDIMRFHRLRMLRYQGFPQGKISPGFSWLIIRGHKRRQSHDSHTFTEKDRTRVEELQDWIKSSQKKNLLKEIEQASSYTKISSLKAEDKWFNLALQVISVHPSSSDNSCAIIVGWDSTVPMFESFCYCMMGEAKDEVNEKLLRLSAGRAIKIHCFDDHVAEALRLKPGQFIQIVNVHAKVIDDHTVNSAAISGFIDHKLLNEERTWLGIVMHKGTLYGRRINVLSEHDAKNSEIKKEIELFMKEQERESGDESQNGMAGPSGVKDGNMVCVGSCVREEDRVRAEEGQRKQQQLQQQQAQQQQEPQPEEGQRKQQQLQQQEAQQQQEPEHEEGQRKQQQLQQQEAQQQQEPEHEEGQRKQQQAQQSQQQPNNETYMDWDNIEISSIADITSCKVFPSKFLCRVDTWRIKLRSLDEMILLCCENCNENLLLSCLPDEAMIEDETMLCGECGGEVLSRFQFPIRIHDGMSYIDVRVCNEAAEEMFQGITANEIRQSDEAKIDSLKHLLKRLISKGRLNLKRNFEGKQNMIKRSALQCCIRCYREESDTQNSYIAEHLKLVDL